MRILITGAKGNLGSQLMKELKNLGEVIAFDRQEIDITKKDAVNRKISSLKPDIIINTAAYNNVDKCEEDKDEMVIARRLNQAAVGYLADAALSVNAVFIHFSTNYVFAGDKPGGYLEDDLPKPVSQYGVTKFLGEQELINRAKKGLKYFLIRTSKLFGPIGKSELSKPSFFDLMLKLAETKNSLDIVDGELSNFTYTPDLAKADKGLIAGDYRFGIYHLTNADPVTWLAGAIELFRIKGVKININAVDGSKFPRSAKRPSFSELLNTKFPSLRSYNEALKEYLKSL